MHVKLRHHLTRQPYVRIGLKVFFFSMTLSLLYALLFSKADVTLKMQQIAMDAMTTIMIEAFFLASIYVGLKWKPVESFTADAIPLTENDCFPWRVFWIALGKALPVASLFTCIGITIQKIVEAKQLSLFIVITNGITSVIASIIIAIFALVVYGFLHQMMVYIASTLQRLVIQRQRREFE